MVGYTAFIIKNVRLKNVSITIIKVHSSPKPKKDALTFVHVFTLEMPNSIETRRFNIVDAKILTSTLYCHNGVRLNITKYITLAENDLA